jgi:hypothetical protein
METITYLIKVKSDKNIQELLDFIEKMDDVELEILVDENQAKKIGAKKMQKFLNQLPEQNYQSDKVVKEIKKIRKELTDEKNITHF